MKNKPRLQFLVLHLEELIASFAIAAMLVICSANVFARYILKHAISWADEVNICLLAWATFVGSAAAYKRNLHYGMDFLIECMSTRMKIWMRGAITFLIFATCVYLTQLSVMFTLKAVKVMPYSRFSYKWVDMSAVIGFGSMMIHSLYYLYLSLRKPQLFLERYSSQKEEEK